VNTNVKIIVLNRSCAREKEKPSATPQGTELKVFAEEMDGSVEGLLGSPTAKGKERERKGDDDTPELELTDAQKKKRSFERSLAGPSVGKAGLLRDQTGKSVIHTQH